MWFTSIYTYIYIYIYIAIAKLFTAGKYIFVGREQQSHRSLTTRTLEFVLSGEPH